MPFRTDQLDEFSRAATRYFINRHPEWEMLATARQPDGYDQAFADFEIPCPSPAVDTGLWISTADEEITVGFHTHHSHFTDYQHADSDPTHVPDALEYATSILAEHLIIVTWVFGRGVGRLRHGGSFRCVSTKVRLCFQRHSIYTSLVERNL